MTGIKIPAIQQSRPKSSGLRLFNSIQGLQQKYPCQNLSELVENTKRAFDEEPWEILEKVWISLQGCMEKIMDVEGGGDYKIPHLGKSNKGKMVTDLICDIETIRKVENIINSFGNPNV